MGASGEKMGALLERILKLPSGNESQYVSSVIDQDDVFPFADARQVTDGFRKEEEALSQNHNLWPDSTDEVFRSLHIDMIAVLGKRKVDNVFCVLSNRAGTMMADMTSPRRRIDDRDVTEPDVATEDGIVGDGATYWTDIGLTTAKEGFDVLFQSALYLVYDLGSLIVTFSRMPLRVSVVEIGAHDLSRPATQEVFTGNQIQCVQSPLILFFYEVLYMRDISLKHRYPLMA
jgi:hypothetical protein